MAQHLDLSCVLLSDASTFGALGVPTFGALGVPTFGALGVPTNTLLESSMKKFRPLLIYDWDDRPMGFLETSNKRKPARTGGWGDLGHAPYVLYGWTILT